MILIVKILAIAIVIHIFIQIIKTLALKFQSHKLIPFHIPEKLMLIIPSDDSLVVLPSDLPP